MLDQDYYRKLISGKTGGIGLIVRFLLRIISLFYAVVVVVRNCLYDIGWLKIHRAGRPVICVGNITAGGTGKTPLVIWLCNLLSEKKKTVVLTRGYKSSKNHENSRVYLDEPQLLKESCPNVEVIVNSDRVAGVTEGIKKYEAEIFVMDDGFQHRRLYRDIDIVTIDATEPFGYSRLLPAGLLREPIKALRRTDAVVLTRTDQVDKSQLNKIEEQIMKMNKELVVARTVHRVMSIKRTDGEEIKLEQLKGKRVFAFCGIGNPGSFMTTLSNLGAEVVGEKIYNDHYHYGQADIREFLGLAERTNAELILTTQKDFSKIDLKRYKLRDEDEKRFVYLEIELCFKSGEEKIRALIEKLLGVRI